MRIDYLGLEAFVAIADHGSFQRAAKALNLSQTALSHRLRKVEDDLGAALLIRSNREVSLTAIGQSLLPDARRLMKELHDTYQTFRARARKVRTRVCLACLPTLANSLLPEILAAFARERPDIAIELLDIPVQEIAQRVQSGEAEFGVTIVSAHLPDLKVRPLIEEDYVLVVPQDHELAERPHVVRADLEGLTMARISAQSRNRQLVEVALGDHWHRIDWHYEVQNARAAMGLVAERAAFAILPRMALTFAPTGLVALPFGDVRLSRTLGTVTRRGVPMSEAAARLLSMVEARLAIPCGERVTASHGEAPRDR